MTFGGYANGFVRQSSRERRLIRHFEGGVCPRNPSGLNDRRALPHSADSVRNEDASCSAQIVGMPTIQVILEGLSNRIEVRE